jgi:cyclophilin family peptidyl-prolyl cis-trans isomerase
MKIIALLGLLGLLISCSGGEQPAEPGSTEKANASEAAVADQVASVIVDKTDADWKSKVTMPEMMSFEAGKTYVWELETNHGTMTFDLFHEASPMHVSSTIYLTELGFYDDIIFHRVIPGFMAQGGDPTGTGRGGPAYKYDGEFAPGLSHTRPGLLSMANAGPGTDGSQFFITFVPTPFLDGKHTIFGELTSGMEVLKELEARGSRSGQTSEELKIVKARILVQ